MLLGIDVGGTKVALCVGEMGGALRAQRTVPTQLSGDARRDVDALAVVAREVVSESGLDLEEIQAVGVSLPGPLDPEGARVLNPPNLPGWHDVPVRDLLRDAMHGRTVLLENDANAAALAEWHFGAGRGFHNLVYLTMSTGVGGGVILDGRLHRGRNWSAGEIGHTALVWEGEPCFCGLRGCAEAYLGGRAWAKRLAEIAPRDGRVAELAGGAENATPVQLVQAAKEGDAFALGEIERFNRHLAHTLVNLSFTLDPDVFVLGTIVAAAGEELVLGPVRRLVREHLWPRIGAGLEIRAAELGKRLPYYAGLGAALAEPPSAAAPPG